MTGTLKVLGFAAKEVKWDTNVPESIEVARETFTRAMATNAVAFDTTEKPGKQLPADKGFDPEVKDQTIVPPLAGGC